MLEVRDVCKGYSPERRILENVSFTLGADETMAVVGPSGCGKTTLLYMLCGLSAPDCGRVSLSGRGIGSPSSDISIILQDYGLLPWKTVLDNVSLGLKLRKVGRSQRDYQAREQLRELGIVNRDKDYPAMLSGGEQQRVAIARAFVTRPRLMLLDEPFSSLDALTREKLQNTMLSVWEHKKVPYVLVTHSLEEAVFLGRRILVLSGSPARPVACFDNPGFGSRGYRDSEGYFSLLRELRQAVEAAW